MKANRFFRGVIAAIGLAGMAVSMDAGALTCGAFDGRFCKGAAYQYDGGFRPNAGEYGGFGGAFNCAATHTPVVFVHGNGDNATSWDAPTFKVSGYAKPPYSVYQQFKAAGYKDCELYGVTYLSEADRSSPQLVYEQKPEYAIVEKFIKAVMRHTGQNKVDIVSHSLGVSTAMAALTYYSGWGSVRRFVNIAGALHGLDSCLRAGFANFLAPTCGSQNLVDGWTFGLYPDSAAPGINGWTGTRESYALPNTANSNPGVAFYTIHAGINDEVMCVTAAGTAHCGQSPLLRNANGNVKAQLDVGAGANAQQLDWNWSDGMPWNVAGGDLNGVGHFHARRNTGAIIQNMLTTNCSGTGCANGYFYGPYK